GPARSRAVPVIGRRITSSITVTAGEQNAIPDVASRHSNATVTLELFHPMVFGAGSSVAVIVGAVESTLTDALVSPTLPARSTALRCGKSATPSFKTVIGDGHVAMPEFSSLHS